MGYLGKVFRPVNERRMAKEGKEKAGELGPGLAKALRLLILQRYFSLVNGRNLFSRHCLYSSSGPPVTSALLEYKQWHERDFRSFRAVLTCVAAFASSSMGTSCFCMCKTRCPACSFTIGEQKVGGMLLGASDVCQARQLR